MIDKFIQIPNDLDLDFFIEDLRKKYTKIFEKIIIIEKDGTSKVGILIRSVSNVSSTGFIDFKAVIIRK